MDGRRQKTLSFFFILLLFTSIFIAATTTASAAVKTPDSGTRLITWPWEDDSDFNPKNWVKDIIEGVIDAIVNMITLLIDNLSNWISSFLEWIEIDLIGYDTDVGSIAANVPDNDLSHPDYSEGEYDGWAGMVVVQLADTPFAGFAIPIATVAGLVIILIMIYMILWVLDHIPVIG